MNYSLNKHHYVPRHGSALILVLIMVGVMIPLTIGISTVGILIGRTNEMQGNSRVAFQILAGAETKLKKEFNGAYAAGGGPNTNNRFVNLSEPNNNVKNLEPWDKSAFPCANNQKCYSLEYKNTEIPGDEYNDDNNYIFHVVAYYGGVKHGTEIKVKKSQSGYTTYTSSITAKNLNKQEILVADDTNKWAYVSYALGPTSVKPNHLQVYSVFDPEKPILISGEGGSGVTKIATTPKDVFGAGNNRVFVQTAANTGSGTIEKYDMTVTSGALPTFGNKTTIGIGGEVKKYYYNETLKTADIVSQAHDSAWETDVLYLSEINTLDGTKKGATIRVNTYIKPSYTFAYTPTAIYTTSDYTLVAASDRFSKPGIWIRKNNTDYKWNFIKIPDITTINDIIMKDDIIYFTSDKGLARIMYDSSTDSTSNSTISSKKFADIKSSDKYSSVEPYRQMLYYHIAASGSTPSKDYLIVSKSSDGPGLYVFDITGSNDLARTNVSNNPDYNSTPVLLDDLYLIKKGSKKYIVVSTLTEEKFVNINIDQLISGTLPSPDPLFYAPTIGPVYDYAFNYIDATTEYSEGRETMYVLSPLGLQAVNVNSVSFETVSLPQIKYSYRKEYRITGDETTGKLAVYEKDANSDPEDPERTTYVYAFYTLMTGGTPKTYLDIFQSQLDNPLSLNLVSGDTYLFDGYVKDVVSRDSRVYVLSTGFKIGGPDFTRDGGLYTYDINNSSPSSPSTFVSSAQNISNISLIGSVDNLSSPTRDCYYKIAIDDTHNILYVLYTPKSTNRNSRIAKVGSISTTPVKVATRSAPVHYFGISTNGIQVALNSGSDILLWTLANFTNNILDPACTGGGAHPTSCDYHTNIRNYADTANDPQLNKETDRSFNLTIDSIPTPDQSIIDIGDEKGFPYYETGHESYPDPNKVCLQDHPPNQRCWYHSRAADQSSPAGQSFTFNSLLFYPADRAIKNIQGIFAGGSDILGPDNIIPNPIIRMLENKRKSIKGAVTLTRVF